MGRGAERKRIFLREVPVSGYVEVPEYLTLEQNFFDQPPFSWILLDHEIPVDFFVEGKEIEGVSCILRVATDRARGKYLTEYDYKHDEWVRNITKEYFKTVNSRYGDEAAMGIVGRVRSWMDGYPHVWEYLDHYVGRYAGNNTRQYKKATGEYSGVFNKPSPARTYGAYATTKLAGERGRKLQGLAEELPAGELPGETRGGERRYRVPFVRR